MVCAVVLLFLLVGEDLLVLGLSYISYEDLVAVKGTGPAQVTSVIRVRSCCLQLALECQYPRDPLQPANKKNQSLVQRLKELLEKNRVFCKKEVFLIVSSLPQVHFCCFLQHVLVALFTEGFASSAHFRNKLILTCNSDTISCSGDISGFVFKGIVILLSNNILLCSVDGAFTG